MRFKATPLSLELKHSSLVNCIAWLSNEEIYSCSDDHLVLRWSCMGKNATKVAELPDDIFPTSLHCLPRLTSSKSSSDLMLLLTSADGKLLLLSASGRLEKTVEAHKAAILTSKVSRDGSSIVTGAEDGSVRVWSRSAMLRSTVATTSAAPVFACDWSPDSQNVAYAQGGTIVLKPLSPSLSVTKWQGHDGVVLSLAWSPSTAATIATGAEDCRYKVWDTEGRLLYSCPSQGAPVTSLAWSWDGALLAVGAHNSLRLSLATGWSCWVERLGRGGVQSLAWSKDNSQIAVACGSGHVLSACIIDREVEAGSVQAHMTEQRVVRVRDLKVSDQWEVLEMKHPVLHLVAGYDHIAISTSSQCLVYNINSINTPAEIKLPGVMFLQLTAKFVLAVNETGFLVFTLEGRPVNVPRLPTVPAQSLTPELISLSPDTLAVRDNVDQRVVHLLGVGSLRGSESQAPRVKHSELVRTVTLSQTDTERCLALVDHRGDLFLVPNPSAPAAKTFKLATMVRCICWNASNPYLAVLTESSLIVWFYPQTVGIDASLLTNTLVERELSELGTSASLSQFTGCLLEVRRQDQVAVTIAFSPAPAALYITTEKGQWDKALALVRRAGHASGLRAGCMHSLYAVRCRTKLQPRRAMVAYTALGCVDTVEMLLSQE